MTWPDISIGDACPRVLEEWRVVDGWWTELPTLRHYQVYSDGHRTYTRMRQNEGPWTEVEDAK